MNNEIGRKITSLTIMTIMIAGGMTFAVPGVMPAAHAANANLFVSAENSTFDNYMSGPQVIEVVVIDSDINDTDQLKGEPDVTVNGKILRMVQGVDGNWYGYFADRTMAQIADSTSGGAGVGLDFGTFCSADTASAAIGANVDFGDTNGVAIPGDNGIEGQTDGDPLTDAVATCTALGTPAPNNVVRESKAPSVNGSIIGQIGIDSADVWPFIQLYTLNPTGNVEIQYNKGGGAQTAVLTFDTVDNFVQIDLDRSVYPEGTEVHATITDLWLNIDPTDEDSWTFGTVGTLSTNYQVFDENGGADGDTTANTDGDLFNRLSDLMCEDNCILEFNPDVQGKGTVATIQDNGDSAVVSSGNIDDPTTFSTINGNLDGNVPITITEQGPNSGVFGTQDESDTSIIRIVSGAARGTSATFDYNESPTTILVGFSFASVDIKPVDSEWSSGEEIPVELTDNDANKNSRADEDLDLNNPNVDLIPSLRTGSPTTLSGLTDATLGGDALTIDDVQQFSDRAMLTSSSATIVAPGSFTLEFGTMDDFFDAAPVNDSAFHGFALFNYDIRSLSDNVSGIDSFDITLGGVLVADDTRAEQDLILLTESDFEGLSGSTTLDAVFTINGSPGSLAPNTTLPVVADVFGFGFINDGLEGGERIANQLIRLELEETGDNTGIFAGSLEYTMINQLNVLDSSTYTGLSTIADDPSFIVIEDLTDEDSPRVNYFDLGADGVSTQVADQEEAPSHSGIVSFDLDTYKTADTVVITLQDADLNVDSDLIDIFTTVSGSSTNLNDVVGSDANNLTLSDGDELGRVLDVTFDDQLWTASNEESCTDSLIAAGIDTGLAATGFTLIETDRDSGMFEGAFQIPAQWCRAGSTSPESATGLDIEVNYVDFRDASGEIIEVGASAGIRANTGSVSLDRTVYPVPFGVPNNFGDLSGDTSPDNRSIFAIHSTGINDDLTKSGSFLANGDLIIHVRVNDPDFDVSASGEDKIAQNTDLGVGPVQISVIRGSETVILGYAGGVRAVDGTINVGSNLVGDGMVSNGEITVTSSTTGFPSDNASDASNFDTGAVTITQGANVVDATFTDNAANGIDSGSELDSFNTLISGGDLSAFTDGLITIMDSSTSEIVPAIFTNTGADGLGAGSEISQVATVGAGAVLICQTGMSSNDCAEGIFVNEGTSEINGPELEIETSVDIINGDLPTLVELDDTNVSNTSTVTATASWIDLNDDTNVDDGELTIINDGLGYTAGDILEIVDPSPVAPNPAIIGTVTFNDSTDTLETAELTIKSPPSGNGFDNGSVTITPNPTISGVSAKGTFVDTPSITQFGPINEIAPDAGIFEVDVSIQYTDGPSDATCPTTTDFNAASPGIQGELTRFNAASPSDENYCILQGDILQVEYTDPADASGDINTVTDSATFDLRNGVLQSDKSVYIIGSDMILTLIEPDLDLDNDQAETWDLDLIEWDSDAATITMGDADGEGASFDPEPLNFRETGDSTGIFQIVIEIPEVLENDRLERGEEIILEYTDWGPSGSDFVGDEDEDVNLTIYTSNFGATIELDQKVYSWTDKAYITVVAPDHNFDSNLIDEVGNTDLDPIKISTRGSDLDNYKLVETGTDTGIFTGEVILTGFTHDADGDSTTGDSNGNDIVSRPPTGNGPTDGLLPADDDDGLTVSFEFSEDETVVGSALIRWNIGEVQWLEASYPASGTGVVRVIDPDMNLDPEAVDNFSVDVWSDSDAGGIDLTVTETNEATGIFEGTVFFTVTDESSGHRLRVAEGDTVTAEYEDNTLPDPYTTADELDITATSLIGTVVPPLERAPAANCRIVDAFGNTLNSVSVDQQVQITCDVANGQDREQPFAYLIQIQDSNGVTVSLNWITGSLSAGQSFSPALSWIPTANDSYDVTAFVWESVDNPTALSPPVDTPITVN